MPKKTGLRLSLGTLRTRTGTSGGWGRLGLRPCRPHELFVVKQLDPRTGNAREAQINMASFHEVRIALLDTYMDGLLDDDKFLVLWQAHKSKNPEFPYEEHG